MKRITTLMLVLMGCVSGASAQTVAGTATDPSNIKDGYYVMLAKTGEGTKTDDNGNFVYYNSSDNKVYYDAKGSTTSLIGQTVESVDLFKYFFYVKNTNGKLTVQAWNTSTYWPSVAKATNSDRNPGQVSQITQSASAVEYAVSDATNSWFSLSFDGDWIERTGNFWNYKYTSHTTTDYVVLNSNQRLGYWDESSSANAQFQFYAVSDVPSVDELVTFTYNYTFKGTSKATSPQTRMGVIGRAYPDIDNVLPDFVTANKPSGTVKASDNNQSIEIVCTENLPFKTSTDDAPIYYYLENVQGDGTRLYANGSSLAFRTAEQAANVNDVRNDLWYVTGNVFDGFQFHSVRAGNVLHSAAVMSHSTALAFSGAAANTSTWSIKQTSTGFSVCPVAGSSYYYVGVIAPFFPNLTDSNNSTYSWSLDDDAKGVGFKEYESGNDAFSYRMVEPTFTFPMYAVDKNTYNSFAAPFDVELADKNGAVKMYKGAVDNTGKELVLSQVEAAPANAGVVLVGENSNEETVTFKVIAGAQALESNDLVGTTAAINASDLTDKLVFGVSDQTGEVGFFSANSSVVSLSANHAYLNRNTASQVKGVSMRLDGEATALGCIEADKDIDKNAPIYDITGRRVARMDKGGIYIQNGRKVLVK